MRIINLADDRKVNDNLLHDHGLSFYLETEHKKYLFDTGATEKFIRNANRLGVSIRDVDALFISHNHYDHIGGLEFFMEVNKKAKIYIKQDALNRNFYMRGYIQCPLHKYRKKLTEWDRIVFVNDDIQVDNIHLVSDTNGNRDLFAQGTRLYVEKDGQVISEDFTHEMFLVYINDDKANIISACSHRGIINIIETTKSKFNLPINYVIGGFHLSYLAGTSINCSEEYYFNLVDYLEAESIEKIYTCHCTGKFAYEMLKRDLKSKIDYFYLGNELGI